MWSVLKRLFYFFLGALVFNFLCFAIIRHIYLSEYNHSTEKLKQFRSFLFADSHGLALKNELEAHGIFNFATASDNYADMQQKLLFLEAEGIEIDQVLITVDNYTLGRYRDKVNNHDRSVYYSSLGSHHCKNLGNFLAEKYLRYYFPVFNGKDRDLLLHFFSARLKEIFGKQSTQAITNWTKISNKQKLIETRAKWQFPDAHTSEQQTRMLKEIAHFCKEKNIRLVGIQFPVAQGYRLQTMGKNYGADKLFLSQGLPVFRFGELSLPDSVFENQDHLTPDGGKILARYIGQSLDSLQKQR